MKYCGNSKKKMKKQAGFSLIELAVVMAIIGILMAGLLQTYRVHQRSSEINNTMGRLNELSSAMQLYYFANRHLPCPAYREKSQNDPLYGKPACPPYDLSDPDLWPLPTTCNEGLCRVAGQRSIDHNGSDDVSATHQNFSAVLIGSVPFKVLNTTLNLSRQNVFDGWGRAFTYAVTERLTREEGAVDGGYGTHLGTIGVGRWNVTTDPITGVDNPPADDVYVNVSIYGSDLGSHTALILSHGPDGMGAYTSNGSLVRPCASGPDETRDSENCDNDSQFTVVATTVASQMSLADGPFHFDDIASPRFTTSQASWRTSDANPDNIFASPAYTRIGIGEDDPQVAIDVNGNILLNDDSAGQTGRLRTANLCNQDTAWGAGDCFNPQLIGGTGMGCTLPGQVMVGIANGAPICEYAAMQGVNPGTCSSGEFIIGFDSSGDIICGTPGI